MEMDESLSALDRAMVEMIWETAKRRHAHTKPGLMTGTPCHATKRAAKGRRKVNRPHTAMYSSSSCPKRFITVFRSTWQSAAVSARASHMRGVYTSTPGYLADSWKIRGKAERTRAR
jgi:hypothetical protein